MNLNLFLIGLAKVVFGVLIGAVGVFIASRTLGRLLRLGKPDEELKKGNLAEGVIQASAIISFGYLASHAVSATFNAIDLGFRGESLSGTMVVTFIIYGLVHVVVAFTVGALVLWFGAWLFNVLTRGVDEMAEVRKGNVAPALVMGAVLIVLAIVTAPGLEVTLEGLLPLPTLDRNTLVAP